MIQEESVMVEVTENDNNAVCRNRLTDPGAMIWPMTAKVNANLIFALLLRLCRVKVSHFLSIFFSL